MRLSKFAAILSPLLLSSSLSAQYESIRSETSLEISEFSPNKSLREQILAFGNSPENAERAAMIKAWEVSRKGVFKVKGIDLGTVDGEDFCLLSIEHKIYEPPDTERVGESSVGFGKTPREAANHALVKTLQRIRENPRSRPNLRRSSVPDELKEFLPMPKSDERDFIVKTLKFWGSNNDWRCYIDFEYLEMK